MSSFNWRSLLVSLTDSLGTGLLAGALAGAVAGGVGSRLAMRVAGLMADPIARRSLTDAGAPVGVFTVDGTLFLIFLGGFLGALPGGLFYTAIRRWLPASGWRRGLLFGVLLFVAGGSAIVEGDNPDFTRLGSAPLNLAMFFAIFVAFGLLIGPLAERLTRTSPAPTPGWPGLALRVAAALGWVGITVFFAAAAIDALLNPALTGDGLPAPLARLFLINALVTVAGQLVSAWASVAADGSGERARLLALTGAAVIGLPLAVGGYQTILSLAAIIARVA